MVITQRPSLTSGSGVLRGRPAQLRSPTNGHSVIRNPSSEIESDSESSSSGGGGNAVVRVGKDYQAVVPKIDTVRPKPAPHDWPEHAVLVWSPYNNLPEKELEDYLVLAKDKFNYNMEQALGMLCWHKFNINTAKLDLPNFTPFPDEWTVEDKVLFEQAFQFHDKHFHKIKQMLPDKSMGSLVRYYYSWKKTRTRTSLMDRQARKLKEDQKDDASDAASDAGSDTGVDNTEGIMDPRVDGKARCENCCTTATGQFHTTPKGILCNACHSFWKRTGTMKSSSKVKSEPSSSASSFSIFGKRAKKLPRGMYVDNAQLLELATNPPGHGDIILKGLDTEIVGLKRQVQNNKQMISQTKHKISQILEDDFNVTDQLGNQRPNPRWTKDEELLAVQALRKYGKNFAAVADIVGNKTESHVRAFYTNNERRYHLDKIIEEFNADNRRDGEENTKPSSHHTHNHHHHSSKKMFMG